jgi:hypothetical protein
MLETLFENHKELEKLLADNPPDTDWKREMKFFKTNLKQLQLERIIHLMVTLTVGLATLLSCFVTMIYQMFPLFILDGILMVLFIAYILHYRKLENMAQSWYPLLNALKKKII